MIDFYGFQVVVSEADGRTGIEVHMAGVCGTALNGCIPVIRAVRSEHLQLVHPFEIPADGAFCAMYFEGHLAFWPLDDSADFERALPTVFKLNEGTGIIFVGHRFFGTARTNREMGT